MNTAANRPRDPRYDERRTALRVPAWLKGFPMLLHGYAPPEPSPAPALGSNADELDDRAVDELLTRVLAPHAAR